MSVFSAGLRTARKAEGVSQIRLARLVGVSVDTVRRWEAGIREPRASEIRALAEVWRGPHRGGAAGEVREAGTMREREMFRRTRALRDKVEAHTRAVFEAIEALESTLLELEDTRPPKAAQEAGRADRRAADRPRSAEAPQGERHDVRRLDTRTRDCRRGSPTSRARGGALSVVV